jgi:hypothetical protein
MNLRLLAPLAAALAIAACSDDAPSNGNPAKLWLGLDGSEVQVKLVSVEPPPF